MIEKASTGFARHHDVQLDQRRLPVPGVAVVERSIPRETFLRRSPTLSQITPAGKRNVLNSAAGELLWRQDTVLPCERF